MDQEKSPQEGEQKPMEAQDQPQEAAPMESKNPMGESKSGGGAGKTLMIIGGVLLVLFILAAVAFFFIFKTVADELASEVESNSMFELEDGTMVDGDDELPANFDRDVQIELMLSQYEAVVAATAEDVSWEEYFVELDEFIDIFEELTEIDPDPSLLAALDLFKQSRAEYEVAVQVDDPDAPIDEEGVEQAGVTIGEAQDLVNEYLERTDY